MKEWIESVNIPKQMTYEYVQFMLFGQNAGQEHEEDLKEKHFRGRWQADSWIETRKS